MTAEVAVNRSFVHSPALGPVDPIAMASPLDQAVDSPASVAAFVMRCQQEVGNHARATLASKLASLCDSTLRASFIDNGGLNVITDWLDETSPTAVVLHALEALATLPLTAPQLESNEALLKRVELLKSHSDERISSLADDTYSAFLRKLSGPSEVDVDVDSLDGDDSHSKFRTIKIDKSTHDVQSDPSLVASVVHQPSKLNLVEDEVAFEEASTPTLDHIASPTTSQTSPSNDNSNNQKKKKPRRSVTWRDDALESVKLFRRDEWIDKDAAAAFNTPTPSQTNKTNSKQAAQQTKSHHAVPLRPSIDWKTPDRITTLSQAIKAIHQARGKESSERTAQPQREQRSLQSFTRPHELPPNPMDDPSLTSIRDPAITINVIPFDPPPKNNDLLARLNSLTSLIKSTPPAVVPPISQAPTSQTSSQTSSQSQTNAALASLSSLINTLKAVTPANHSTSQPTTQSAPAVSTSGSQTAGQSKLMSLLSGGGASALGNIAAALAKPAPNASPLPAAHQPAGQHHPPATQPPAQRWGAGPPAQPAYNYPPAGHQPTYPPAGAPHPHTNQPVNQQYQPPTNQQYQAPYNYQYPPQGQPQPQQQPQYGAPYSHPPKQPVGQPNYQTYQPPHPTYPQQPQARPPHQPVNQPPAQARPPHQPGNPALNQPGSQTGPPAYQYPPPAQAPHHPPAQAPYHPAQPAGAAPYQYGYQQPPAAAPYHPPQSSYPPAQPSYQPGYQSSYQPSSINQPGYQPPQANMYQPIDHKRKREPEIDVRTNRPRTAV